MSLKYGNLIEKHSSVYPKELFYFLSGCIPFFWIRLNPSYFLYLLSVSFWGSLNLFTLSSITFFISDVVAEFLRCFVKTASFCKNGFILSAVWFDKWNSYCQNCIFEARCFSPLNSFRFFPLFFGFWNFIMMCLSIVILFINSAWHLVGSFNLKIFIFFF